MLVIYLQKMSLWNRRNLPQPPTITFKATNTDLGKQELLI